MTAMSKIATVRACAAACFALLVLACNGNTVQSPTSQAKQCFFDTECMSSQRCSRAKDNLMGLCVDKVAAQPADGTVGSGVVTSAPADASTPGTSPPPAATIQPQPGDISL